MIVFKAKATITYIHCTSPQHTDNILQNRSFLVECLCIFELQQRIHREAPVLIPIVERITNLKVVNNNLSHTLTQRITIALDKHDSHRTSTHAQIQYTYNQTYCHLQLEFNTTSTTDKQLRTYHNIHISQCAHHIP